MRGPSTARTVARRPEQVHELFAAFAAAGDVDGLVSLFEADALLHQQGGAEVRGSGQLRAACAGLCARGARVDLRTDAVRVSGDLALVAGTWTTTTPDGAGVRGRSAGVVRRQPDGRWLAVIADVPWIG